MILYNHKVFEGAISGTTPAYTAAEWNAELARAARWFVAVRASQGGGTSPQLTLHLEHSNDDVNWAEYNDPLIEAVPYSNTSTTILSGFDRGTVVVPGAFVRIKITLGGTSPRGVFEVWCCGRDQL